MLNRKTFTVCLAVLFPVLLSAQVSRNGERVMEIFNNLTLEEAAAYFGIGINKLREISDKDNCPFVLWVGSKRLIKRKMLEEYLSKVHSV